MTPETSSGKAIFDSSYVIGAAQPGIAVPIMEYLRDDVKPRTLALGANGRPGLTASQNRMFPPPDATLSSGSLGTWQCGYVDDANVMGKTTEVNLACVLQYGFTGTQFTAIFDWQQGTYNVPACSWMRVSALPWGAWPAAAAGIAALVEAALSVTVAPGNLIGARVPCCSGAVTFDGAGPGLSRSFAIPKRAGAFDFHHFSGTKGALSNQSSSANGAGQVPYVLRDVSLGLYYPPWGPVQITPGFTAITLTSTTVCVGALRFFLQL